MNPEIDAKSPNWWRNLQIAARPTLLFVAAYALNATPHELAHAIAARLLGFSSTVYQMWVNPDSATATPGQLAAIAVAGPVFSLTFGVLCLLLYARHFRLRPSGLIFLMLALVGVDCFLGPMAGAAFGGDFHAALNFLGAPAWAGIAVSLPGWIFLAAFMFAMGRELVGWVPQNFRRNASIFSAAVAPALIGTLLIVVLYWPLPQLLVFSTIDGAFFWFFAAAGAAFSPKRPRPHRVLAAFTLPDAVVCVAAIALVRVFAMGIRLAH
jgi:hypothetical protein